MLNDLNLQIAGIIKESIVDGPGIRLVIFTQGCPHHCKGCHNQSSWDLNGGKMYPISRILSEIKKNPLLDGVTFSGGEPFLQAFPLSILGKEIQSLGLNLMTYTGYTWENLNVMMIDQPEIQALLKVTDWLVDGPFEEAQKSIELRFRGSSNQRILDVRESFLFNQPIQSNLQEKQNFS